MNRLMQIVKDFLCVGLILCVTGAPVAGAVSSEKQLEKAKQLYAQHKDEQAMDLFIDVLVNGSRSEVEEANKYVNLIHSRIGGIQDPIEVDIDFQEGKPQRLKNPPEPVPTDSQVAADAYAEEQQIAQDDSVVQEVESVGLPQTALADQKAILAQQEKENAAAAAAAATAAMTVSEEDLLKQQEEELLKQKQALEKQQAEQYALAMQTQAQPEKETTFTDLSSPEALRARQLYTNQKLENMKQAVVENLRRTKGVRIYFRNNLPDAIDIDSDVLFQGNKFRPDAATILNQVYALMALTQGAGYIILPPGSYTDDITLAGIRQAMALNSYFVHKGISSGRISYNLGLFDQEPPAKFANLEGLSIVFDFDAELPSALPDAASLNRRPMLSMAVVPMEKEIDPSAGDAVAIDFSVIETANPIDNWVFQIIQHRDNGMYYGVRQLEGFTPVYHQLLWNGRKGIIGPELACGTYTLALTATDIRGIKNTVRRQIQVACHASAQSKKKGQSANESNLNYKSPRLWHKPGRIVRTTLEDVVTEPAESEAVDVMNAASVDDTTPQQTAAGYETDPAQVYGAVDPAQQPYEQATAPAAEPSATAAAAAPAQGVSNPYDMPYEEYGN